MVALALALVPSGLASAARGVLYVNRESPRCSDAGAGSLTRPFCTIGAAAGKVRAGQTVRVAAGTYPEMVTMVTSGTAKKPISFVTAPGATVTVSGQTSGLQTSGFVITGKRWISVKGFRVTNTKSYGIIVTNSAHITLRQNRVSLSGRPPSGRKRTGIRLDNVADSLVAGNTADHNTNFGIALVKGSTRNDVRNNHVFANARGHLRAAAGIRLTAAPGNTVRGNVSHHNEDSGIEAYAGSHNTLLYNNVTYDNGDHGIDNSRSTGQRIVANTVYRNLTSGINVEGGSTGAKLWNNISVDNGIDSPRSRSNIRVDRASISGTTLNYDLVHATAPNQVLVTWSSTDYFTLASFHAATGQEARGIEADPRFANPAAGNLHLAAGSPAIDSANSRASGQPTTDANGRTRVDDPVTPNTGPGPRAYHDRGALEFQAPLAAVLSVSPSSGRRSLRVSARATRSAALAATPIATYTFDFGDGSRVIGPRRAARAAHIYRTRGRFTVTVTVTDTAGLSSQAKKTVTVR
jgi:parallel beta-helix repeat protein